MQFGNSLQKMVNDSNETQTGNNFFGPQENENRGNIVNSPPRFNPKLQNWDDGPENNNFYGPPKEKVPKKEGNNDFFNNRHLIGDNGVSGTNSVKKKNHGVFDRVVIKSTANKSQRTGQKIRFADDAFSGIDTKKNSLTTSQQQSNNFKFFQDNSPSSQSSLKKKTIPKKTQRQKEAFFNNFRIQNSSAFKIPLPNPDLPLPDLNKVPNRIKPKKNSQKKHTIVAKPQQSTPVTHASQNIKIVKRKIVAPLPVPAVKPPQIIDLTKTINYRTLNPKIPVVLIPENLSPENQKFYFDLWSWWLKNVKKKLPNHLPMLGKRILNLKWLFISVVKLGGFGVIKRLSAMKNDTRSWQYIYAMSGGSSEPLANPVETLRKIYHYYLLEYENFKYPSLKRTPSKQPVLRQRVVKKRSVVLKRTYNILKIVYLTIHSRNNLSVRMQVKMNIFDTEIGKGIVGSLPFYASFGTIFGDLVYFKASLTKSLNVRRELEEYGQRVINKGEIAYWLNGQSVILGYGATPISVEEGKSECRLLEDCVVFGSLKCDVNENTEKLCEQISNFVGNNQGMVSVSISGEQKLPPPKEMFKKPNVVLRKRKRIENINNIQNFEKENHIVSKKRKTSHKEGKESDNIVEKVIPKKKRGYFFLFVRYRFEGETELDYRLIRKKIVKKNFISGVDLKEYLKEDFVDLDNVMEIRFWKKYDDLEIDGWMLMRDTFKINQRDEVNISITLKLKKKK